MSYDPITFTLPGLDQAQSNEVVDLLQYRLASYNDLHLVLKHVHWNVTGPHFIAVHEMLDPQVDLVRGYADEVAERIATLGGSPKGTSGAIQQFRDWDDYSLGRDTVPAHLAALDKVYIGVITSNRDAIKKLEALDVVTQDMVISETAELEKFQWFIRAHLENRTGVLIDARSETELSAAEEARSGIA